MAPQRAVIPAITPVDSSGSAHCSNFLRQRIYQKGGGRGGGARQARPLKSSPLMFIFSKFWSQGCSLLSIKETTSGSRVPGGPPYPEYGGVNSTTPKSMSSLMMSCWLSLLNSAGRSCPTRGLEGVESFRVPTYVPCLWHPSAAERGSHRSPALYRLQSYRHSLRQKPALKSWTRFL